MTKQTALLTVLALLISTTPANASWLADRIDGVRVALQLAEPPLPDSDDTTSRSASEAIGRSAGIAAADHVGG